MIGKKQRAVVRAIERLLMGEPKGVLFAVLGWPCRSCGTRVLRPIAFLDPVATLGRGGASGFTSKMGRANSCDRKSGWDGQSHQDWRAKT